MVELHIHPPLSYRLSPQRARALVLQQPINPGETLGDLLGRLWEGSPEAWQDIYEPNGRRLRPLVVTSLNGRALPGATAAQAPLTDGDRVTFHMVLGGG